MHCYFIWISLVSLFFKDETKGQEKSQNIYV